VYENVCDANQANAGGHGLRNHVDVGVCASYHSQFAHDDHGGHHHGGVDDHA
jgi:hypothetical protein